MAKFAVTISDLAKILNISREELGRKWVKKPGWPRKSTRGWDITACQLFMESDKKATAERTIGVNADLKREKLKEEVKILKLERQKAQGLVIPIEDHERILLQSHGVVKSNLIASKRVAAQQFTDIEMVKAWGKMVDDTLRGLKEGFEK